MLLDYFREWWFEHPSLQAAFCADAAKSLELLHSAAHQDASWITPEALDLALRHFPVDPAAVFWTLHAVAERDESRAREMLDHWVRLFPRAPAEAIDALYYVCTNNPQLLRPDLVGLMCAHCAANASQTFQALQVVLARRPELVTDAVVGAVLRHLPLQVNQAFYFLREAAARRPEFTPLCTLALFEAVLLEPHPAVRAEMLGDLRAVATHSHVRTELERALRAPAKAGSAPARALLGLLFRQRLRAQQRVLLDALDLAARWPAVWSFLAFLLEGADPKTASPAAAADFLEAVYRLHYLVPPWRFGEIVAGRLDLAGAPDVALPDAVAADPELAALHRRVSALALRFGAPLRLTPLKRFREQPARLEAERRALADAQTTRRLKRRQSIEARLARSAPTPAERRRLARELRDALRAEAVEITRRALDLAAKDATRDAAARVLGREVDVDRLDPAVLPAFLYLERLGDRMPNNRRWLARLIEDRLEGRPHDWMRTEPDAVAWADRVRAACPDAKLDRWRAPFSMDFSYRPADAAREKRERRERDLAQTRELLRGLGVDVEPDPAALRAALEALRNRPADPKKPPPDPRALEEIALNLERVRIADQAADSDYEGGLRLEVETDPFQVLFMGEYGFSSCLSLRGSNMWSAVSNAIDVDKCVVWARDPAGNIVGRRLIALVPEGVVSYRTYTNRHGLALDGFFERFLDAYAAHCGTRVVHGPTSGPLLSDEWYDDGAI
jgi:hypothetical protein